MFLTRASTMGASFILACASPFKAGAINAKFFYSHRKAAIGSIAAAC